MMAWNDERVAILKKMWLEGNSASEIAKELGNITRNAVIGKVHRLGLSNRDTNISKSGANSTKAIKNVKRGRPPKVNQEPKKRGRPQKPKGPSAIRDKINEDDKKSIEDAINQLKASLEGDDSAKIASDLEALTQEAMKLGEAIYKAQEDTQNNETESPEPEDSTIVDADFEEVDEDKNT